VADDVNDGGVERRKDIDAHGAQGGGPADDQGDHQHQGGDRVAHRERGRVQGVLFSRGPGLSNHIHLGRAGQAGQAVPLVLLAADRDQVSGGAWRNSSRKATGSRMTRSAKRVRKPSYSIWSRRSLSRLTRYFAPAATGPLLLTTACTKMVQSQTT